MVGQAGGWCGCRNLLCPLWEPLSLKQFAVVSLSTTLTLSFRGLHPDAPPDSLSPSHTPLGFCEENTFVKRLKQIVLTYSSVPRERPQWSQSQFTRPQMVPRRCPSLHPRVPAAAVGASSQCALLGLRAQPPRLRLSPSRGRSLAFFFRECEYLFTLLAFPRAQLSVMSEQTATGLVILNFHELVMTSAASFTLTEPEMLLCKVKYFLFLSSCLISLS